MNRSGLKSDLSPKMKNEEEVALHHPIHNDCVVAALQVTVLICYMVTY